MGLMRRLGYVLLWALIVLVVGGTLLPLIPSSHWFIRIWDYPRLQGFFLAVLAILLYYTFHFRRRKRGYFLMIGLGAVVVYQAVKAYPYTPFAPQQVLQSERDPQDTTVVCILIANVLQFNTNYDGLLRLIEKNNPDVVVTVESDAAWQQALEQVSGGYPHAVRVPLSNTYGMHLYSRLPIAQTEVMYLLEPDIPSIQTRLRLRSGEWVQLYIVHPRPPVPGESSDSRERDAEIVIIGKRAKAQAAAGGVIVAGDFNDVAWSPTTKLFQEVSGLLDPRKGRGFYNTFNARYPLFRWPLDHVFHSQHFKLVHMQRLPDINSDHFPMLIRLSYEPEEKAQQPQHQPEEDTAEEADKIIEKGVKDTDAPGE